MFRNKQDNQGIINFWYLANCVSLIKILTDEKNIYSANPMLIIKLLC